MRSMSTATPSPHPRPLRVLLVRHGESQANVEPTIISGRSSHLHLTHKGEVQHATWPNLLDTGKAQADALGRWLGTQQQHLDRSAVRAKETAKVCLTSMSRHLPVPEVKMYDALEEIHMGDWVGRNRDSIYTDDTISMIQKQPWIFAPPNGESQKDVEERMVGFLKQHIVPLSDLDVEKKGKEPVNVIIFGHALAFKCLLRWALDSTPERTWKFGIDNTSVTELLWTRKHGWHFMRMNDTSHLAVFAKDVQKASL